ncbi:MAG: serine/threonine-protein kinase, partial [Anaerolineae bacterium]|nr:serine/threonine-protein kinase [Anaerolineae bacterium]
MLEQLIGQSLDRYEIVELLGEGGMGGVFRARDATLQRDVAVKVMHAHFARQANFQERFLQEARTAARLDHPGIVKVYDFGQAQSLLYIVMELIRGDNLRQLITNLQESGRTLPLPEAVQVVRQLCLAIDYAHRQGVLHRDIKPDNIMLKPEPSEGLPFRPVLTDLGLAKLA